MKLHWVVVMCTLLAGCSSGGSGNMDTRPIEVSGLAPSYDSGSDSVDLAISFTNVSKQPLRQVQIEIQAYDASGTAVKGGGPNGVAVVTLNGPFAAGVKVGPLISQRLWYGSNVQCLEVVDVSVSGLDYSSANVTGAAASQLVAADTRRICKGPSN